jgi:hypothetical protein
MMGALSSSALGMLPIPEALQPQNMGYPVDGDEYEDEDEDEGEEGDEGDERDGEERAEEEGSGAAVAAAPGVGGDVAASGATANGGGEEMVGVEGGQGEDGAAVKQEEGGEVQEEERDAERSMRISEQDGNPALKAAEVIRKMKDEKRWAGQWARVHVCMLRRGEVGVWVC